jgi:hypothetical protein
MDCDDVISVCDTERSSCSAAAEDERSTAVADLQSAIKVSEQELTVYKQQLSDAGLTKVLFLLSSNLEALAVQADSPLLVVKSTEVALRLKKQQQQLQELHEQYRVRSVLQTLGGTNERVVNELAPIRKQHADNVRLMKAQLQVELDNYLTATPYYLISLKGWQTHALQLRNKPTVDIRLTLTPQFCAYKAQLIAIRDAAAAVAAARYNSLPFDKQQNVNIAKITAATVDAIDARCTLLAKTQQLIDEGSEPDLNELNTCLIGNVAGSRFVMRFPVSAGESEVRWTAVKPEARWEVAPPAHLPPAQLFTFSANPPAPAAASAAAVSTPAAFDSKLLLPLPKLGLSCHNTIDLPEAEVMSCGSDTVWIDKPNDQWSTLHHQLVVAAWTAYEQQTGRTV